MSQTYSNTEKFNAPPSYSKILTSYERNEYFSSLIDQSTYPPQAAPAGGGPVYMGQIVCGEYPIQCTCPHCKQMIVTRTQKKAGILTWLICGGIILVGGWCGCCFIPFCIDAGKVSATILQSNEIEEKNSFLF